MQPWADIWRTHGCPKLPLPDGAHAWPPLPCITASEVEDCIQLFKINTAAGPSRIAPRALLHLSQGAYEGIAYLFNGCEAQLAWPNDRVWTEM
eukprot:8061052-Pyramimonas_sp.AAC.1